MNYKLITLDAEPNAAYPPEFMEALKEHQMQGWNLVFIAWEGKNPMVLFQRAS